MKSSPVRTLLLCVVVGIVTSTMIGCGNNGGVGDERAGAIFLTTNRPCLEPDGRSSAAITALVTDAAGYPAQIGTDITFITTRGYFPNNSQIFSTEIIDWAGETTVSLMAGFDTGWAEVEATANSIRQAIYIYIDHSSNWPCECTDSCDEEEADEDEEPAAYAVDPTSVKTIDLHADAPSAVANGLDSVMLTLRVQDSTGATVPIGTPVALTTTLGQFANGQQSYTAVTTDESGIISSPLFAGTEAGMATVYASYDGESDMIAIGFTAP